MGISHDLGTLCVPCFLVVRSLMGHCGQPCNYRVLVVLVAAANLFALLLAAQGVSSISTLMVITFIGGSCGYLVGVVHQAHLAMQYQDRCFAVFRAGDNASGVLCVCLAIAQQPWLSADEGRRFGPQVVFLTMAALVPLSLSAFFALERLGAGRLGTEPLALALGGGCEPAAGGDQSSRLMVLKESDSECAGSGPVGRQERMPSKAEAGIAFAGVWAKPRMTAGLALLSFALQFSCWGITDSAIPYACAAASPLDEGKLCVFRCGFCTALATMAGALLSSLPDRSSPSLLLGLVTFFTILFLAFCDTVTGGPLVRLAGPAAGNLVVLIVLSLRLLNKLTVFLAQRFVQTSYEPEEMEDINAFLFTFQVAGNLTGTLVAASILALFLHQ